MWLSEYRIWVKVALQLKGSNGDPEYLVPQIAEFMGPTLDPPGSCRPQMGPVLTPWTLLSETFPFNWLFWSYDDTSYLRWMFHDTLHKACSSVLVPQKLSSFQHETFDLNCCKNAILQFPGTILTSVNLNRLRPRKNSHHCADDIDNFRYWRLVYFNYNFTFRCSVFQSVQSVPSVR